MFWLIFLSSFPFSSLQSNEKERHYLYCIYTALTKADNFPAFSAEAESDNVQISRYSNKKRAWVRENLTVDDWSKAPAEPPETREWYLDHLKTLTKCKLLEECPELHVLQRIIGCELEKLPDGTVTKKKGFDKYGFDGKDLITFNYDAPPWMDKVIETKMQWDQTGHKQFLKGYISDCLDWLLTFNNTYKSSPDVHISARKVPDDHSKLVLMCLATGFYPRDVQMNIRRNKYNLEDQTSSGIRPNEDETFQMRISVKINRKDKGSFDCLVIHSSLTEPVSKKWDRTCSNCEAESQWSVTAALAVPFSIVICCCIICNWRRLNDLMGQLWCSDCISRR